MYKFAVTLKDNHTPVEELNQAIYEEWITNAKRFGFIMEDYFFENDTKGRLHLHGIGTHNQKSFLKKKLMYRRMHQRIDILQEWIDIETWRNYMKKDQEPKIDWGENHFKDT